MNTVKEFYFRNLKNVSKIFNTVKFQISSIVILKTGF